MRAVLDTNILVSGLFWQGPPTIVWQMATDGEFTILASQALFAEYTEVLSRRKFAAVFAAIQRTPDGVLSLLRQLAELVEPADVPINRVRDEKDRMILACAVGGKADVIVSGDEDLVTLGVYENVPIMTAAQFLVWWQSARP